ncbi:chitin deacetylase 1 [Colletotrichum tofieldiae]|nr:chitin deacetylase 1 [Colletotrichum tofieldiae]
MPEAYHSHPDYGFPATSRGTARGASPVPGPTMPRSRCPSSSTMKRCVPVFTLGPPRHEHVADLPVSQGGERSVLAGDGVSETNLRENPMGPAKFNERNYNVESEYEYGSRAGFWRLFRLFNSRKMKFTLYAVAQAVEEQPEVAARCVEEGHDVASHAYRWIDYHDVPVEKEKEYIRQCITSLKSLTGYAPRGWYYGRNSPHSRTLVPQVYEEMGEDLVWASDTYADDVPYWIDLPSSGRRRTPRGA